MRANQSYWTSGAYSKSDFVTCYIEGTKSAISGSLIAQSFSSGAAPAISPSAWNISGLVPAELLVDGTVGPDDIDVYTVNLVAGQTYLFSLYGSGDDELPDTFLYLLDGDQNVINYDDDGGAGTNSLLTFTATSTGTYYIGAGSYPGSGMSGSYTFDMVTSPGTDVVGDTFETATPLTLGGVTYGFIDSDEAGVYGPDYGEIDTYSFYAAANTVLSIEVAGGADYESLYFDLPPGELDTRIVIYNAAGEIVAQNDDISFSAGDISSRVSFIAPADGTYYLDVFSYAPWTGGYSITSESVDLADLDPLDSINWFSAANVTFDANNTAYVYFGDAGETFGEDGESFGWNDYEIQQVMQALEQYEIILGVNYEITTDIDAATFRLFTTTSEDFGAYFYPQDPGYGDAIGVGAFNVDSGGWDKAGVSQQDIPGDQVSLVRGGYSFAVILHEFGHAHGLAHPHDNGGGSDIMLGVVGSASTGIFDLNQGVYTVMSYNDGWENHPDGPHNFSIANIDHGWSGSLSAFDIALLQQRYGVHAYAEGNTVYELKDENEQGTFYETIWDSGGSDAIVYNGARDAQIDLLAATLDYSPTGGGVLSYVSTIFGGYTIANGVVIENAAGGSGDDLLLGNSSNNTLDGNAGDDVLMGREGDDILIGRAGSNELTGGAGSDSFVIDGAYKGLGTALVTDFDSSDTLTLTGMAGMKVVYEQSGTDVLISFDGVLVATVEDASASDALASTDFRNSPKSTTLIVDGVAVPMLVTGTSGNDTIQGTAGIQNVLMAGGGNDVVTGKGKADTLYGNGGNDILHGANGDDNLFGGLGRDELYGGSGDDILFGNNGHDLLVGGNGDDTLIGGAGHDTFQFDIGNRFSGVDRVVDYTVDQDFISFTSTPASVTFTDSAGGAQMYVNGILAAVFEGVSSSAMAGEWTI